MKINVIHMGTHVLNQKRKINEDPHYYPVLIRYPSGAEEVAFFTPEAIRVAKERGDRNDEDAAAYRAQVDAEGVRRDRWRYTVIAVVALTIFAAGAVEMGLLL